MSDHLAASAPTRRSWHRPMIPRSVTEPNRAATPLELFFDLCFVVAVAQAADRLHHALADGHARTGILGYLTVFFAIWWAWMNVTWFASAYDTDDVPYRLAMFVQIGGALILAAGVPRAVDDGDFTVITLGYAVMRSALVGQWLRAAHTDRAGRRTALRFAAGVTACTVGWGMLLLVPDRWRPVGFAILVAAELAVPVWAEHAGKTAWHPEHIAERYGLFTLIVLGESVLAATIAIQSALDAHEATAGLYAIAAGGLMIVFSMWWFYFAKPAYRFLVSNRVGFLWGYGHMLVFASAAAVGAGLAVGADRATGHADVSAAGAGAAVTVPVAVYLITVWFLHLRPHHARPTHNALFPAVAFLVLAAAFTAVPVLVAGLLLAALVAASIVLTAAPVVDRSGPGPRAPG